MAKGIDRIRNLFEIYSKNLQLVIKHGNLPIKSNSPFYICPLCKGIFSQNLHHVEEATNVLTIEHAPPKSVGATCTVLTCKKCNNTHGGTIDSHLKRKIDFGSYANSENPYTIPIRFKVNDMLLSDGELTRERDGVVNITFDEKRTNPKYKDELIDLVKSPPGSFKIEMNFRTYNSKKANLSIIRAAYLMLFQKLGYAFIFTKSAEHVRQCISNPNLKANIPIVVKYDFPEDFLGLNVIVDPSALQSYLVVLNLGKGGYSARYGIFIPAGNDHELEVIKQLHSSMKNNLRLDFESISIPDRNYLTEAGNCLIPVNAWHSNSTDSN